MSQWWQIINVDRREISNFTSGYMSTWFFQHHHRLLRHLTLPCLPKEVDEWLKGPIRPPPGAISKLPVETIDLIFEHLSELHEVIHLSITCKSLLIIGKRHILQHTRAHYAPWAGSRLISLGDDTHSLSDLPPNLLTDAEHKEITETEIASLKEVEPEYERNLTNFSGEFYTRVFGMGWRQQSVNCASRLCYALQREHDDNGELPEAGKRDHEMFSKLYGDGRGATYPEGTPVLCNLPKGEIVRQDGLTEPLWSNLAHALLSQICWSRAMGGDRFCVTTLEHLSEVECGRAWKDVTSSVRDMLGHIWVRNERQWASWSVSYDIVATPA
ncbi:hypothetical protein C8Q74DRAFT_1319988 [Fomes fomentarius]|nr:hypothetical protein C8Q74DRAFT_1319988 [Fomes fomentarius]